MAKDKTIYHYSQHTSFKSSGISSLYLDIETPPYAIYSLNEEDRAFFLKCTKTPVSTKKDGKRLARILITLKAAVKTHNVQ